MRPIILSTENEYDACFKLIKDGDESRIIEHLRGALQGDKYLEDHLDWMAHIRQRSSKESREGQRYTLLNVLMHLMMVEVGKNGLVTPLSADFGHSIWGYNGFRFYIDHYHPEYSAPECVSVRELLCHNLAGDVIVEAARDALAKRFELHDDIVLMKNNSDGKGNSYGAHENFMISPNLYFALTRARTGREQSLWTAFLIARQIIAGAGKVGCERQGCSAPGKFEIAQRSDFIYTTHSMDTMQNRPIINTRMEPHADGNESQRLHVIIGDANRSQWSNYLKFGTALMMLQMLEEGFIKEDVVVGDPITATHNISCDITLKKPVIHLMGRGDCSSLDLMEFFHGKMKEFLLRCEGPRKEEFSDIVDKCGFVLSSFREDKHMDLAQYLDWPAKFVICENRTIKRKIPWDHHDIRMTDFQYHYLNPKRDMFSGYKKIIGMNDIVSEKEIADALTTPPLTRAFMRGTFLRYLAKAVTDIDWTMVGIRGKAIADNRKIFSETVYRLPDPAYPSNAQEAALEESRIKSFAAALGQ